MAFLFGAIKPIRYLLQEWRNYEVKAVNLPLHDCQIHFLLGIGSIFWLGSAKRQTHTCTHTHTYTKASKQSSRQREIDYLAEQVSSLGQDSRLLFHYLFFYLFVSFWVTLSQSSSKLRVFSNLLYIHFNKGQPKPVHQSDILNQTSFANRIIH